MMQESQRPYGGLADFYARYGLLLQRRAQMLLRDPELASDALQDTFVKVMRAAPTLSDIEEPLRWLYRILDRTCLDLLRRRKLRPLARDGVLPELASPHPEVGLEVRDLVLQVLRFLDDSSQQLAIWAFLDGMGQQEIAGELGVSRATVNKKLGALRNQLETYARQGGAT